MRRLAKAGRAEAGLKIGCDFNFVCDVEIVASSLRLLQIQ